MPSPSPRATGALSLAVAFLAFSFTSGTFAQRPAEQPDAAHILHEMEKLPVVGSVLYIAAHPDDENTKLIAWLANGKEVRTGYLSLTRGDGGQDLLGPELGDALGIIRTEELLQARRIDGGEQFFTRASDFGYSKNAKESFAKWGHDAVLSDMVRVIRTFRPDIIITRFPPTREAGHGHHEASAILAHEAFDMAGDPTAFPEQLKQGLTVWQPRRLYFNGSTWWKKDLADMAKKDTDWYSVDVGGFDPLLGLSYTELAGRSRSMHKSQGFGAAQTRGEAIEYLHLDKGDRPTNGDIFDGIDMTWNRIKGGEAVGKSVDALIGNYDMRAPEKSVEDLSRVATAVDALPPSAWKDRTRKRVDKLLLDVTGTVVEALADAPQVVTGDSVKVLLHILTRSSSPVQFDRSGSTETLGRNQPFSLPMGMQAPLTPDQPYWLALPHGNLFDIADATLIGKAITPQELEVPYTLRFGGIVVKGIVPVLHETVDRVKGELTTPVYVVPRITLQPSTNIIATTTRSSQLNVDVIAHGDLGPATALQPIIPEGWDLGPASVKVPPLKADDRSSWTFRVTQEDRAKPGDLHLQTIGKEMNDQVLHRVDYPHIVPMNFYTPADVKLVPLDVKVNVTRVGYIMGAGDEVPQALEQLGITVDLIDPATATLRSLSKYDAIVTGIRAYNVDHALKDLNPVLMQYVHNGGTLVDQYNTQSRDMVLPDSLIGPYPFTITRDRVTVEEAPPTFLDPKNPLMTTPNTITTKDFDGYVQERGTYFLGNLDPRYKALIAWNDPGEAPMNGALVMCDYGKGRFVYTGIGFFRQLPAGVPGAYRLFANLIAKRAGRATDQGNGK
jgi:LmbE family N-acetylglucosaminyl deacetylase